MKHHSLLLSLDLVQFRGRGGSIRGSECDFLRCSNYLSSRSKDLEHIEQGNFRAVPRQRRCILFPLVSLVVNTLPHSLQVSSFEGDVVAGVDEMVDEEACNRS